LLSMRLPNRIPTRLKMHRLLQELLVSGSHATLTRGLRFVKCPNPRASKNGKYPHLGQEISCKSRGYARPPPWGHNIDRCISKLFVNNYNTVVKQDFAAVK
jgi:hypothetical protein